MCFLICLQIFQQSLLIQINVTCFQLGIPAGGTTIYTCLNNKSDQFDKVMQAADLINNTPSVVKWAKEWLVNFNATNSKLLSVNHLRDLFLPSTSMADAYLQ